MNAARAGSQDLGHLLAEAFATGCPLRDWPENLVPSSAEEAYAVQGEIVTQRNVGIGGWKVGAKSSTGPIQGAPLPTDGVHVAPATLKRSSFSILGLELEIAFYFGRTFLPSKVAYSDEEVLAGVNSLAATIEVISSRFEPWPRVDKLCQLADLQNHGALVVGSRVEYDDAYPFINAHMKFSFAGTTIADGPRTNPAGDPRRLLGWLVNHCTGHGLTLTEETVITAGSYTGVYFPSGPGIAVGEIAGLPPVSLTLT